MKIHDFNNRADNLSVATNAAELNKLLTTHIAHHRKLGQTLLIQEVIKPEALREALQRQKLAPNKRVGEILVDMGATTKAALQNVLVGELDVPTVALGNFDFDPKAAALISPEMVREMHVVPLMFHSDELVVASYKLPQLQDAELLRFTVGQPIRFVLTSELEIDKFVNQTYQTSSVGQDLVNFTLPSHDVEDENRVWKNAEQLANKAPLVQLVNLAIQNAINRHASDIHIRPNEKTFELIYRIDGTLLPVRQFPIGLLPAVVSRIKILAKLNIAERRLPQDGRIRIASGLHAVDLRISIIPVEHGESVVIRVLNKNEGLRPLKEIGFSQADLDIFLDLLKHSYGIILVTGPTGSGKTTTLYAALQEMRHENINVITVEDPIEYELENVRQIQVLEQIGFGFPQALKHILRHDPDVIMIGEMRDVETCKIAVESALTGHLVFSTLHTNDAPSALVRLMEIGVAPYMIRSSVIGVLAQRLVRRNCEECLCEEVVSPMMRKHLGLKDDEIFYRGAGCSHCNQTGFKGRLAIYELLALNDELRKHIQSGVSSDVFRAIAIKSGMTTLATNGVAQARAKKISIAEIYRSCM